MDDKELLELAAKAAGIVHDGVGYVSKTGLPMNWNPLTDDGDALRLAVALQMQVYVGTHTVVAEAWSDSDVPSIFKKVFITNNAEEAARRAIVLAAAEIGRGME